MKKIVMLLLFALLLTSAASAEGMTQTMTLTLSVPDRVISVYTGEHAGILIDGETVKETEDSPAAVNAPRLEDTEILLTADEGWIVTEVTFDAGEDTVGVFDAENGKVCFTAVPADETIHVTAVPDVPGWGWEMNADGETCAVVSYSGDSAEPEVPAVIGDWNVTRIADGAFENCENITKVTIPLSVGDIGADIFGAGSNVIVACHEDSAAHEYAKAGGYEAEVTAHSGGPADCVTDWTCEVCNAVIAAKGHSIAFEHELYETTAGTELALTIVQECDDALGEITWTGADNGTFASADCGVYTVTAATGDGKTEPISCTIVNHAAQPLTLPSALKRVGTEAFMNDTAVEEIVLPQGCTAIEAKAFAGCTGLAIITLPESTTAIAEDAFEGCDADMLIICSAEEQISFAQTHGFRYMMKTGD